MKKYIVIAFLLAIAILALASQSYAADWSQYESGRDNIRLDGYQGQNGYIAFTDGSGNVQGYIIWNDAYDRPAYCTDGVQSLTTTEFSQASTIPFDQLD